jgi:hypothetical protein
VKLKSLEQSHGPVVAEIRDRVQLRDPPAASGGSDHAASRLGGVTLTDVLGQQRKAKIGVSQEIALDEAADSYRYVIFSSLHQVHAISEGTIRTPDLVPDVAHGVCFRADPAISNVLEPGWLIEKSLQKRCIS